jgi:hypothetical protein
MQVFAGLTGTARCATFVWGSKAHVLTWEEGGGLAIVGGGSCLQGLRAFGAPAGLMGVAGKVAGQKEQKSFPPYLSLGGTHM